MEMELSFNDFFPQGSEIRQLYEQIQNGRVSHAIMFTGLPETGKTTLAGITAKALLCRSEKDKPCGVCDSCVKAEANEHPDLIAIRPGEPIAPGISKGRNSIPVDDIREMIRLCGSYSNRGGNRVVIIDNADHMTVQAQNALLKIIEEPPESTFFLLTVSHGEMMLNTIVSRCRTIRIKPWNADYIESYLLKSGVNNELAHQSALLSEGAVGKALRLSNDNVYWELRDDIVKAFFCMESRSEILKISNAWKDRKNDSEEILNALEGFLHAMLAVRFRSREGKELEALPACWQSFANSADPELFDTLSETVREARRRLSFNVSFQQVFESLILTFMGVMEKWKK